MPSPHNDDRDTPASSLAGDGGGGGGGSGEQPLNLTTKTKAEEEEDADAESGLARAKGEDIQNKAFPKFQSYFRFPSTFISAFLFPLSPPY